MRRMQDKGGGGLIHVSILSMLFLNGSYISTYLFVSNLSLSDLWVEISNRRFVECSLDNQHIFQIISNNNSVWSQASLSLIFQCY